MKLSLFSGFSLVLCAASLLAADKPVEMPPARGQQITALLAKEGLGPLRLNQPEREVLQILGQPGKRSRIVHVEADGLDVQQWLYPKAGLMLKMASSTGPTGSKFLAGISARDKCPYATQRGIHVGSAKAAVQKAYAGTEDLQDADLHGLNDAFVVGSIFGGITFQFTRGQVSWIYVGAVVECRTGPVMRGGE